MRQVPAIDRDPFGVVGDGRVARHFCHYFDLLGLPYLRWTRREPRASPPDALASCGPILLLISDTSIVPFVEAWPALRQRRLVHFSGRLVTAAARAAHPLMTFGADLYDIETYRALPFILDADGPPLPDLLPGLPNPSFTIPAAERPYYHALCVLAGNCSTLLWQKLFDGFERRLGLPPAAAHPYLARVAENLMTDPGRALTGPLARGDADGIAANLQALEGDPFLAVYAAFVRAHGQRA
jgi:hypothetical protein